MVPFARLLDALRQVPDPRRTQGLRYPLPHLLLFAVLAILRGATSYRSIRTFIGERNAMRQELFAVGLTSVPAVNTLRDVLHKLDADALEAAFRRHAEALLLAPSDPAPAAAPRRRPVLALDGKTLRHSFDHLNDRQAAQVLSAFAGEHALILGHLEIDDTSNAIPAVEAMIRRLGVSGVIFTVDAMHCQKTFQAAADTGNAIIAQIKGNQPLLLDTVQARCATVAQLDTVDRHRHGRQEHRRVEVFAAGHRLGPDWADLITVVARVTRLTWHKHTQSGYWIPTEEVSYYASQIVLPAAAFADAIRGHWGIENRNHYVRDVTLAEDASRIRILPGRFARLRSMALNILRANGITNVRQALYANALNLQNLLSYRVI